MESNTTTPSARPHPLLLAAAASVTVLGLAGVGVLAGWLPGPGAHRADAPPATMAAAPATSAPISIQQTVGVPQEKPRPAAVAAERPAAHRGVRTSSPAPSVVAEAGTASVPATAPVLRTAGADPSYVGATPVCVDCGIVEAVREVAVEPRGSGGGAVAGGLVGGILGNQIGKGATRDIATVLGAVGGAFAGNHIEKSVKEAKRYDVLVHFDDGSTRTFSSDAPPAWHSGDRVRLQNGVLTAGTARSGTSSGVI